ncbi:MAG: hypothetical protein JO345_24825 [Streptosporangiaceae bacterium]|nr:hypothetical protein [Streptosporangiaceae bacterium]
MKLTILLGAAALALAVASAAPAAAVAPASPAAAAAALPLGPFQLQDNDGDCADARLNDVGYHIGVLMDACDPLILSEQFTYDPLTLQILSVGQPGNCLQAILSRAPGVNWLPCDASNVSQRWQAIGPDQFGRYYIWTTLLGQKTYMQGDAPVLQASFGPGVNIGNLFRFLLL